MIKTSLEPLVFKVRQDLAPTPEPTPGQIAWRVKLRSLEGMQKEAVVSQTSRPGSAWRMVSDEGPYLNGTDLAPFPLAFFTAGLQFDFMTQLLGHARMHGVAIKSLAVAQDNWYTMTGSALRGDMTGGARPADLLARIESDAPKEILAKLIRLAEESSPAHAVMRDALANTFSLNLNGRDLPAPGVNQSPNRNAGDPIATFESLQSEADGSFLPGIITKVATAERVHGVEGGVASSLAPEQKRTLHVRGEARLLDGMLMETVIQLFSPLGSSFRLLCDGGPDIGGKDSAPPALAYLSAGIGFCYMTQLGRYAQITKQQVKSFRIVQDNVFHVKGSAAEWTRSATAAPVTTHVFIESDEPDEMAGKMLRMGEQTCFLHAAMRGSYRSNLRAELNGAELPLPEAIATTRGGHSVAERLSLRKWISE